ncbi:MAG: glycosyltransferase family 4 protein [Actinomycetes bacterium]
MLEIRDSLKGGEDDDSRLRILCVADEFPWPERTGYKIRLANMLRGLAEAGSVDLIILHPGEEGELGDLDSNQVSLKDGIAPINEPVERTLVVKVSIATSSLRGVLPWLASGIPRRVVWRDWSAARVAVSRELLNGYDLIWWSQLDTWSAIGAVANAPSIIDFVDLEDQKMRTSRVAKERPPLRNVKSLIRFVIVREMDRVDIRRWRRAQRRASLQADGVIVCSQKDRATLGGEKTYVIPNGYLTPENPVGHPDRQVDQKGGALLFIGLQTYEPNIDASRFLIERVLPILQESRPDVSIRIVGSAGTEVQELARAHVKVIGEVESIEAELASADISVVPLRIGGGTRIKILEALAHRIPIVTTNLGCEGLPLVSGVHCEIADSAKAFAESCDLLLGDAGKRIEMAEAGAALQGEHFEWVQIRSRVGQIARAICEKK